jgi:hypothetical protein
MNKEKNSSLDFRDTPEFKAKIQAAKDMMIALEIPLIPAEYNSAWGEVYAHDVYDLFMDEKRLKKLISLLKMKVFW